MIDFKTDTHTHRLIRSASFFGFGMKKKTENNYIKDVEASSVRSPWRVCGTGEGKSPIEIDSNCSLEHCEFYSSFTTLSSHNTHTYAERATRFQVIFTGDRTFISAHLSRLISTLKISGKYREKYSTQKKNMNRFVDDLIDKIGRTNRYHSKQAIN